MNNVVLIGRWTKDLELKYIPNTGTAVATGTLAVDRRYQKDKEKEKEADFIPVVVFGKTAESCANYTAKGKLVGISGRIQVRNYDAKDGTKRYVTEIIADEVQFLEWASKPDMGSAAESNEGYIRIGEVDDGEIPFN